MSLDWGTAEAWLAFLLAASGTAVLHFLWQGTVLGLFAAAVLRLIPPAKARLRYVVVMAALALCLMVFLGTLGMAIGSRAAAFDDDTVALDRVFTPMDALWAGVAGGTVPGVTGAPGTARILASGLWLAGLTLLGTRCVVQWRAARRLTRVAALRAEPHWSDWFATTRRRMGVPPGARLMSSAIADVPMVIGWLKPVVLVPASIFATMPPAQLEAVLIHELAHLRRRDHLWNAIQIVAETLLFFHPMVWWLSAQVRAEREHCCDRAVVEQVGGAGVFARAVARLALLRDHSVQGSSEGLGERAAVASTGGVLSERVSRMLGRHAGSHRLPGHGRVAASVVALVVGIVLAAGGGGQGSAPDTSVGAGRTADRVESPPLPSDENASDRVLGTMIPRWTGEDGVDPWGGLHHPGADPDSGLVLEHPGAAQEREDPSGSPSAMNRRRNSRRELTRSSLEQRLAAIQEQVDAGALTAREGEVESEILRTRVAFRRVYRSIRSRVLGQVELGELEPQIAQQRLDRADLNLVEYTRKIANDLREASEHEKELVWWHDEKDFWIEKIAEVESALALGELTPEEAETEYKKFMGFAAARK